MNTYLIALQDTLVVIRLMVFQQASYTQLAIALDTAEILPKFLVERRFADFVDGIDTFKSIHPHFARISDSLPSASNEED